MEKTTQNTTDKASGKRGEKAKAPTSPSAKNNATEKKTAANAATGVPVTNTNPAGKNAGGSDGGATGDTQSATSPKAVPAAPAGATPVSATPTSYVITMKYVPTPVTTSENSSGASAPPDEAADPAPAPDLGNVVLSSSSADIDNLVIASLIIPVSTLNPETPEVITSINAYTLYAFAGFPKEGAVLNVNTATDAPVQEGQVYEFADGKISAVDAPGASASVLIKNASPDAMTFGLAQPLGTQSAPPKANIPVTAVYVPPWQTIALPLDLSYELWWTPTNKNKPLSSGVVCDDALSENALNLNLSSGKLTTIVALFGDRLVNLL